MNISINEGREDKLYGRKRKLKGRSNLEKKSYNKGYKSIEIDEQSIIR